MEHKTFFSLSPEPKGDDIMKLGEIVEEMGYDLALIDAETLILLGAQKLIKEKGITSILSTQILMEDVLRDATPRNTILDILKYKLYQLAPNDNLLVIDPYLFPPNPDTDYENYFFDVFRDAIARCDELSIVTLPKHNVMLETQIINKIRLLKAGLRITSKYSDAFHDRFWIADESKGVFIGTSLNGIGRRYSMIDFLNEQDTIDIVTRYKSIV